ncbi:MAG: hypothetical protein ABIT76_14795 [Chthoniobacterales bacterium]
MKTPISLVTLLAGLLSLSGLQARPGFNDYTPAQRPVAGHTHSVSQTQPNCPTMTVTTTPKQGSFTNVACSKALADTPACRTACEKK